MNNLKRVIKVDADTEIDFICFDPDTSLEYQLVTNAGTVKYLFNHDEVLVKRYGEFSLLSAYLLANYSNLEEIRLIIYKDYIEIPCTIRARENLTLDIVRKQEETC